MSPPSPSPTDPEGLPHQQVRFAHNAEEQLARLLDFYGVAWEYEPRTFELAWDEEGRPTTAFTPDFFLPADDLYLEVTTQRQELVTKKNRKVRLLRAMHPDIRVKVIYQRDYLGLLVKYGLDAPQQWAAS